MTRRPIILIAVLGLAAILNTNCGPSATDPDPNPDDSMNAGSGEAGDPCMEDADCASGLVCEDAGAGCDELQCVTGCRVDSDCVDNITCIEVVCVTCPCPPLCQ